MDPDLPHDLEAPSSIPEDSDLIKRISEHSYTPIILTAIMLILLFFTTAFIAIYSNKDEEAARVEVKTEPTTVREQEEEDNTTDEWITYTNDEYGFEIKYPANWDFDTQYFLLYPDEANTQSYGDRIDFRVIHLTTETEYYTDPNNWSRVESGEYEINCQEAINFASREAQIFLVFDKIHLLLADTEEQIGIEIVSYEPIDPANCENASLSTVIEKDMPILFEIFSTFKIIEQPRKLAIIEYTGGLCPNGECQRNFMIYDNGEVFENGELQFLLEEDEINELKDLIENTDFEEVKSTPFTDTCPIAYDGQKVTYTFYLENSNEVLSSCTYKIDTSTPLFSELDRIIEQISE